MVYEAPFFYILKKIMLMLKGQRQKQMLKISERMLLIHENVRISRKSMCSVEKGRTDKGKRIHNLIFVCGGI